MCSEVFSPRTSFSIDLDKGSPLQPPLMMLDAPPDFEFTFIGPGLGFESFQSSADELFADGMILPVFKNRPTISPRRSPTAPSLPPFVPDDTNTKVVEVINKEDSSGNLSTPDSDNNVVAKPASRSFWGFKRSASFNNHTADKKGLIFSLPFLARSNSTGSVPNPKRSLQKQPSVKMVKSSSFSAPSSSSSLNSSMSGYGHHQSNHKLPPLSRKTSRGQANNGSHKVNNILNVPTPYIIGTTNMFGIGSFFFNGKDKKKFNK